MNYPEALDKLKHVAFGIVVEDGTDPKTEELIYYMLRFKGDSELESVSETIVNGRIMAVKSGSELYTVSSSAESGGPEQQ